MTFLGPPLPPPQSHCCLPYTQPIACKDLIQGSLSQLPDRDMEAALPYMSSFHSLGFLTTELLNLLSHLLFPGMGKWDGASLPLVQSILRSPSNQWLYSGGHHTLFLTDSTAGPGLGSRNTCTCVSRPQTECQLCPPTPPPVSPMLSLTSCLWPLCRNCGHCLLLGPRIPILGWPGKAPCSLEGLSLADALMNSLSCKQE